MINVLSRLKEWAIKPIFFSTDAVFNGTNGGYSELDKAEPVMVYGKQKLTVEEYIRSNFDKYLIFRIAKTFGINKKDRNVIFPKWIDSFNNQSKIKCAYDCRISPIYIDDIAETINQLLNTDNTGTYHLGGPNSYTLLELFEMLYREFRKYSSKKVALIPIQFNDFDDCEEWWPLDCSLNSDKLTKLINHDFMTVEEACSLAIRNYFD